MRILDVRNQEPYRQAHLPGSTLNPVFQMGFIERIPSEWNPGDAIQVVGQDGQSQEAHIAREKLERAGFQHVSILEGGIDAWIASGNPPEGSQDVPEPSPVLEGTVPVDLEQSEIQWTGRNLMNRHMGTLQFSEASLRFDQGVLTGGDFRIQWDSLVCTDLAGTEMHEVLLTHLKDHDFFDVEAYDAPRVSITSVTTVPDATPGALNLKIAADLTLKDVTRPIHFMATGGSHKTGYAFQAEFHIDRTQWNVKYGSGRFFRGLGMHLVNDTVEIGLKVVTT